MQHGARHQPELEIDGVLAFAGHDRTVELVVLVVERGAKSALGCRQRIFSGRQPFNRKSALRVRLHGAHNLAILFRQGRNRGPAHRFAGHSVYNAAGDAIRACRRSRRRLGPRRQVRAYEQRCCEEQSTSRSKRVPMEFAEIASVSRHLHFHVACCGGLQGNGLAGVRQCGERFRVPVFELDRGREGVDLVRSGRKAA